MICRLSVFGFVPFAQTWSVGSVSVPFVGGVDTVNVRSQVSTSLPVIVRIFGVSCGVDALPAFAVGGSSTAVTVSVAVAAGESAVPSFTL